MSLFINHSVTEVIIYLLRGHWTWFVHLYGIKTRIFPFSIRTYQLCMLASQLIIRSKANCVLNNEICDGTDCAITICPTLLIMAECRCRHPSAIPNETRASSTTLPFLSPFPLPCYIIQSIHNSPDPVSARTATRRRRRLPSKVRCLLSRCEKKFAHLILSRTHSKY